MKAVEVVFNVFASIFVFGLLACFIITALKGKRGLAALGLILPGCWLFGASLVAKPDSWWAIKRYGPKKMALARQEFPKIAAEMDRNSESPAEA